jgi:hypothetical protein
MVTLRPQLIMNIIAHLVGLDDVTKSRLVNRLRNRQYDTIDLDDMQQQIQSNRAIKNNKLNWTRISKRIAEQKKYGSKSTSSKCIRDLMEDRNDVKNRIYRIWKELFTQMLQSRIKPNVPTILIGFNLHPKDYRHKLKLPLRDIIHSRYANRIILDVGSDKFASNIIGYYLDKFRSQIIDGTFPLKLLKKDFIKGKHYKVTLMYEKMGYKYIELDDIFAALEYLAKINKSDAELPNTIKEVFVVLPYETANSIPVNVRTPLTGYNSKSKAIEEYTKKFIPNGVTRLFIYTVDPTNFQSRDGILFAKKSVKILLMENQIVY